MTHREHAALQPVEAPRSHSTVDRSIQQSEITQLPPAHYPVLASGQLGNCVIKRVSLLFASHREAKSRLAEIRPPEGGDQGPGVRSTAASAVAASASRIAAPSRALDSART